VVRQGYGDLIDGVATLNNTPGGQGFPLARATRLGTACSSSSLCSESTDDFDRPLRNDSYVSAVDSWKPFKCWQYFDLHDRIPLQPFMTSRAGFAYHGEYNWFHWDGASPVLTQT